MSAKLETEAVGVADDGDGEGGGGAGILPGPEPVSDLPQPLASMNMATKYAPREGHEQLFRQSPRICWPRKNPFILKNMRRILYKIHRLRASRTAEGTRRGKGG
jgi:hypothetical protein